MNKIGRTKNINTLPHRLNVLQQGNPKELYIKWYFKSKTSDIPVHNHLEHAGIKRTRNKSEWFSESATALQKFIRSKRPTVIFHKWKPNA